MPNTRGIAPQFNPATWGDQAHAGFLLSFDFLVLLDGLDVLMTLEGVDLVLGEVNSVVGARVSLMPSRYHL
jgi:hypothetical protein